MKKTAATLAGGFALILLMIFSMFTGDVTFAPGSAEDRFVQENEHLLLEFSPAFGQCTAQEERYLWDGLLQITGNPYAAAGIMGGLYADSRLNSLRLADAAEIALTMQGETYTAQVSDGSYADFAGDGAGYGIAQWSAAEEKAALLSYAVSRGGSIGDFRLQTDYLLSQLAKASYLPELSSASSCRSAAELFRRHYLQTADRGDEDRSPAYAEIFYNKYAVGGGADISATIRLMRRPEIKCSEDLVIYVRRAASDQWGYVWGTFGNVLTEQRLRSKLEQYPDGVGKYYQQIRELWLNKRTADCVGLIKGYCWLDPDTGSIVYGANGMPDTDTEGLYRRAEEKGLISSMPELPGIVLYKYGHLGVYIGNGRVIEAKGTLWGVVETKLEDGQWVAWMKVPCIEYPAENHEGGEMP